MTQLHLNDQTRADHQVLDHLRREHPGLSRKQLKRWFQEGRLTKEDGSTLLPAENFEGAVLINEPEAEEMKLPIIQVLFEDDELLAIFKPQGLVSQPLKVEERGTALHLALAHCPAIAEVNEDKIDKGLLHRLDRETSGVLLFAKTQAAFDRIRANWKECTKTYRALVTLKQESEPLPSSLPFTMDKQLAHRGKTMALATKKDRKTLVARTTLHRFAPFTNEQGGVDASVLDLTVTIQAGVLHQIRCHLANQGWPILGDRQYRGKASSRLWLHAWKIEVEGKTILAPLGEGWPNS